MQWAIYITHWLYVLYCMIQSYAINDAETEDLAVGEEKMNYIPL
jgi:hypothetical protein